MSDRKWIIRAKRADFYALAEKYHIDPVVARLLVNRDIKEEDFEDFLHPEEAAFHDPYQIEDMNQAVRVIIHSLEEGHKMRIISDYDVDGVMSNYILYTGLKRIGADVDYVIPHRVKDGYGISREIIDNAINDGVTTIVTCDNGIAALDAIQKAKAAGLSVVVTDHHQVPFSIENGEKKYILPPADAILNSKKETCKYPYKELCGAGVAYKFVECLYDKRGIPKEELELFLDFVAVATICDVVPLTGENRLFVTKGLPRLRFSENVGMRALIYANELSDMTINVGHVGFRIGPCINASGRLESAELSMELFLETDRVEAFNKAKDLKEINDERKELTRQGVDKAHELVKDCEDDKVYVIYIPECHESLAGIIAGRIREAYDRPVFVLTDSDNAEVLKGSGRSTDEYHMYEALKECEDILLKFGGHAGAAGFSIERGKLDEFRKRLNDNCNLTEDDLVCKVMIDVPMPISYVTEELITQIESLAPFGQGNPKPLFAQKDLRIRSAKILGKEQNVVKIVLEDEEGFVGEGIYFKAAEFTDNIINWFGQEEYDKMLQGWLNNVMLNVIYYPEINEFNGNRTIQYKIIEYSMATIREVL